MNLFDVIQSGDVLGMLAIWADIFGQAGAAFVDAFTFDISEAGALVPGADLSAMTGLLTLVAIAWVAFMFFTHTSAWKKFAGWRMPMAVSLALAIPMILFAGVSFWCFILSLPLDVIGGAIITFLSFAAALPLLAGAVLAFEKVATALHRR